jgi:hypothetical protein
MPHQQHQRVVYHQPPPPQQQKSLLVGQHSLGADVPTSSLGVQPHLIPQMHTTPTVAEGTHVNVMHMVQQGLQSQPLTSNNNNNNGTRIPRNPNTRPVCKLTGDLIKTYKTINENYYNRKAHRRKHEPSGGENAPQVKQQHHQQPAQLGGFAGFGASNLTAPPTTTTTSYALQPEGIGQAGTSSSGFGVDAMNSVGASQRRQVYGVNIKPKSGNRVKAPTLSLDGMKSTTGDFSLQQHHQQPPPQVSLQEHQQQMMAMDHDDGVDCDDENQDYIIKVGEVFNYR